MNQAEEQYMEGGALRDRLSQLSEATRCIAESLNPEEVLQVVVEGEERKRLRPDFLAEVSLALLTPLSSIKESISTLLDPSEAPGRPEPRLFHRIIDEQADRMQKLTNALLDVTRIESGTLVVTPESTNMAALIDAAHQSFTNAGGRNSLHIELAPRLPEVMADGPRIVQVIENLLSTAARSSEHGSPIRVSAALVDEHVAVSVKGTGIGMAGERLPQLFATWPPRRGRGDGRRNPP